MLFVKALRRVQMADAVSSLNGKLDAPVAEVIERKTEKRDRRRDKGRQREKDRESKPFLERRELQCWPTSTSLSCTCARKENKDHRPR
jgi:hypothetical protein